MKSNSILLVALRGGGGLSIPLSRAGHSLPMQTDGPYTLRGAAEAVGDPTWLLPASFRLRSCVDGVSCAVIRDPVVMMAQAAIRASVGCWTGW